jgi:hypothetical protein
MKIAENGVDGVEQDSKGEVHAKTNRDLVVREREFGDVGSGTRSEHETMQINLNLQILERVTYLASMKQKDRIGRFGGFGFSNARDPR